MVGGNARGIGRRQLGLCDPRERSAAEVSATARRLKVPISGVPVGAAALLGLGAVDLKTANRSSLNGFHLCTRIVDRTRQSHESLGTYLLFNFEKLNSVGSCKICTTK